MGEGSGGGYGTKGKGEGGGQTYGDEELPELHFGSPSYDGNRGGGIIELIADKIINYGYIKANGLVDASGGSIKIQCKRFINNGKIWAKGGYTGGDGRIAIFCEKFTSVDNEHNKYGSLIKGIKPKPFIKQTKYDEAIN